MATTTQTEARVTVASWVPVSLARELRTRAAEGDRTVGSGVRGAVIRHLRATANEERSGWLTAYRAKRSPPGATNATQAATKSREPITVARHEC